MLRTNLAGTLSNLALSRAKLLSSVGASSTPTAYTGASDRGHLASENLDPALQSFETSDGTVVGSGLCGNVSAASLAQTPVPPALRTGGNTACNKGYTEQNSFLDVLVSGCNFGGLIVVINPTQPDETDPSAPVAGSGGPYKLAANASHIVDSCSDSTNAPVDLATCLNAAAYSSYFSFKTDRVIAKSTSAADVVFHDDFDVFP